MSLGLKTRSGVTQDRPNLEPQRAVQPSSQKRQRISYDFSHSGDPYKRGKRVHRTTTQYEDALALPSKDDRIRSLEEENKALKIENESLKKQLVKKFACPICTRSYNRSDGLYKHITAGDKEHRRVAKELYGNTKCETCGKECARWGDLKRHMAVHGQKGSAVELNVEPVAGKCFIGTYSGIAQ